MFVLYRLCFSVISVHHRLLHPQRSPGGHELGVLLAGAQCYTWPDYSRYKLYLHLSSIVFSPTGTASWLTFINLNKILNDQISRVAWGMGRGGGYDQISRVAYVKFVDVWFLVCTVFIFASLLEFAFVNYIARSKESVTIHGEGGLSIFKEGLKELSRSAFTTPSLR